MLDHVLEDEGEEVDGFDGHTDFALLQMLQISGSNEIVSCKRNRKNGHLYVLFVKCENGRHKTNQIMKI